MKKKLLLSTLVALGFSSVAVAKSMVAMDTVPASAQAQVTQMNYTLQPYNKWGFRNTGILPSLMVPRDGQIVQFPMASNSAIADIDFKVDGTDYTVRSALIGDDTDGVVVIKNGTIVYEEYFGDFGPRDHHLWASSTKSLVGQAMGILVEQGKVDPAVKVENYVSELKGSYFGSRTVRDILNMVSALDYSEDYVNMTAGAVHTEYFRRIGLTPAFDLMGTDPTKSDVPRGVMAFMPMFGQAEGLEPSHKFEYHSPNVDVAGWIIARVSGKPLQTFISDEIWSKLGTEHDAFMFTDPEYTPVATGGMNTTLRDFARVGVAMANNGQYNGKQVFSEKWVKDTFALTEEERKHTQRSAYKDSDGNIYDTQLEGYKNYLWVHDSEKGVGTFRGVFGQVMYIDQSQDLVVATFSSAASASNAARAENKPRMFAFDAITDYYQNK
ncbi:serine hydrolase domain-containing protein [Vibrio splendidus]|uniref:serine hydrolase domain-containing protein n=1 Tax=Vibrio splendidus TaxID=29497 RepID=UPI00076A6141|nr:serine hydrolase [Vibrio splendidus]PHX03640.1 6-aminohexanoate-dimer hydrolase [Vibrio splendidus]